MKTIVSSARAGSRQIAPRVKLWLELDGERVFCPGMCQILQAIDETGSIKEAAAAIGRSYRFIWGRLKEAEKALGNPLVETRVGGETAQRSNLTPLGRELVESFLQLRRRIFDLVDTEFGERFKLKSHAVPARKTTRSARV